MGCCNAKETEEEVSRKIAVVGNDRVGKTCFIQRYIKDEFDEDTPSAYIPSNLQVDEKVQDLKNGKKVHLAIYDLGGRETFKHLRKLNYPRSDAAIICFSIEDKSSLESVKDWAQDIRNICPDIPMLLVGLKKDRRDEAREIADFVREGSGHSAAKKHSLLRYIECSASTGVGIKEAFAIIAQEAAKRENKQKAKESD